MTVSPAATLDCFHLLNPDYDPDAFDYTVTPDPVMPYTGGEVTETIQAVRKIVDHAITYHPRSQQKRIGPSEIGTPCDHCLAAKLAGWEESQETGWLPTIGTALHAWLEEQVLRWGNGPNPACTTGRRFLTEQTVTVGQIGGTEITGSCDLFDAAVGTVWDHKLVGKSTLDKVRRKGPTDTYRVQANLYALGWHNAGFEADHVVIWFLPRNEQHLDRGIVWHDRVDIDLAHAALERANRIHANLQALESISIEARDAWITSQARDPDCFSCTRYPDGIGLTRPGHAPPGNDLRGLI